MKTDKFDDAFKRKFEGLEEDYPYSEEDIDKVQNYVNNHIKQPTNFKRVGIVLFASMVGLLITGLFGWNLIQQQRQSELLTTIDSLNNKIASNKTIITKYKVDTVYVSENYINGAKSTRIYSKANNSVDPPLTLDRIKKEKKNNISYNAPLNSSRILRNPQRTSVSYGPNLALAKSNKNIDNDKPIDPIGNINDDSTEKNTSESNRDSLKLVKIKHFADSIKAITTASAPVLPVSDSSASDKKRIRTLISSLKNLNFQLGFGSQTGKLENGYEIVAAVMFGSRWSISSGVKLLKIHNRRYEDSPRFHDFQGNDLNNSYPPFKKDTFAISNNEVKYTLLQIPLTLSYALPLKKNYSLLAGFGTDIDLYSSQRIGFDHLRNRVPSEHKDFDNNLPVLMINNITFSAGIQKQWRNYSFQASPFVSPQLSIVNYKKEQVYAGFRFRLLYNFGK